MNIILINTIETLTLSNGWTFNLLTGRYASFFLYRGVEYDEIK